MKLDQLMQVLSWVKDLQEGEMIEKAGRTRNYLSVKGTISQMDLDAICLFVNEELDTPVRLCNNMGEFIPMKKEYWG